jgi:hypothetical protein
MNSRVKVIVNTIIVGAAVFAACVGFAFLAFGFLILSGIGSSRPTLSLGVLNLLLGVPEKAFGFPREASLHVIFVSALFWGGLAVIISFVVQLFQKSRK